MKRTVVLFAFFGLVLCAYPVAAADHLSDVQMDSVTAGQLLGIECSACTLSSSSSTSVNGITTTTSTTATGSGGGGGGGGPSVPGVGTTVQIPANLAATIRAATTVTGP